MAQQHMAEFVGERETLPSGRLSVVHPNHRPSFKLDNQTINHGLDERPGQNLHTATDDKIANWYRRYQDLSRLKERFRSVARRGRSNLPTRGWLRESLRSNSESLQLISKLAGIDAVGDSPQQSRYLVLSTPIRQ